jgi:hypothetical protein
MFGPATIETGFLFGDLFTFSRNDTGVEYLHLGVIPMISGNEIRLLDLLPFSDDGETQIRCDIRVAFLADEPQYEALSYVWGDSAILTNIEVSGRPVGITKNLYDALRRVRLPRTKRTIWIDQLCINQWDQEEKIAQIGLMRRIYSNCNCVLLWMGEIRADITLADAKAAVNIIRYLSVAGETEDVSSVPLPPALASPEALVGPAKALQSVFDRNECEWWHRIWTVQEAVLPANATVLWGPLSMPWEMMTGATHTWTTGLPWAFYVLLPPHQRLFDNLMCHIIWTNVGKSHNDTPFETMIKHRDRQATDARDKIYGLLGLFPEGTLPTVEKINYTLPVAQVYSLLTIDLILNEEGLRPLTVDPRTEVSTATPKIPRWAFDMGASVVYETDIHHVYRYRNYNANRGRPLDLDSLRDMSQRTDGVLELKGIYADTIDLVGDGFLRVDREAVPDTVLIERVRSWQALAEQWDTKTYPKPAGIYPGGHISAEAFGRAMLGDLMLDNNQRPVTWATAADAGEVLEFLKTAERNKTHYTMSQMAMNQKFFVTKTGLMGLGHLDTEPGDEVWVLNGGKAPFSLRRRQGGQELDYDFVGRCYVQGIMHGEAFEEGNETAAEQCVRVH